MGRLRVISWSFFIFTTIVVLGTSAASISEDDDYLSLEGDTKVNDYANDNEAFDTYDLDWENFDDSGEDYHPSGTFHDYDEGFDSEEETVNTASEATNTTARAIITIGTENSVESSENDGTLDDLNAPAAPESMKDSYEDDSYSEQAVYDDALSPLGIEVEAEFTSDKQKRKKGPATDDLLIGVENKDVVEGEILDVVAVPVVDAESANNDADSFISDQWNKLKQDWRAWREGEKVSRIRRFQTLYTGILVGFFALTFAVVLLTFYKGFTTFAGIVRNRVSVGGGYKRMQEEMDSPVFHRI